MPRIKNEQPSASDRQGATPRLTDEDMVTVKVDRRSFLSKTVVAGSIAVGTALTAACPGGSSDNSDSDTETP